MSFGPLTYFTATMASGADSATVTFPKAYAHFMVHFPTMSTAADRNIYATVDGTNFASVRHPIISGLTSPGQLLVGSGVTDMVVPFDFYAKGIKFVATAVVSGGGVYKIIASD
jgi:hypothetical protein